MARAAHRATRGHRVSRGKHAAGERAVCRARRSAGADSPVFAGDLTLATQYFCHKPRRRAEVLTTLDGQGHPVLNGIDYLEVSAAAQTQLQVHFLFDLPGAPSADPQVLAPANIRIEGGTRITGIHAVSVSASGKVLTVTVSAAGDFSTYTL